MSGASQIVWQITGELLTPTVFASPQQAAHALGALRGRYAASNFEIITAYRHNLPPVRRAPP